MINQNSQHLLLPSFGVKAQSNLHNSSILAVGSRGLGRQSYGALLTSKHWYWRCALLMILSLLVFFCFFFFFFFFLSKVWSFFCFFFSSVGYMTLLNWLKWKLMSVSPIVLKFNGVFWHFPHTSYMDALCGSYILDALVWCIVSSKFFHGPNPL